MTENFKKSEFDSKCGRKMPPEVLDNVVRLAGNLEVLRAYLNAPIHINSGYRSKQHNKSVRGSKNSQHLYGKAADIVIEGYTPDDVADLIEELIENGDILQGGLGRYNTFTHYDIRKSKVRWNFKK